jgi:hypothetical protein
VRLRGHFDAGMATLQTDAQVLRQLVREDDDDELGSATHLENAGFEWMMLAPQWFLQVLPCARKLF